MGIGGGAVLIPALIFLQNVSQQTAQGINLVYFLPTAAVSLIIHIRKKKVELKTALIIGGSGLVGAAGGSALAAKAGSGALGKMFGVFLFLIGIYETVKGIKSKKE